MGLRVCISVLLAVNLANATTQAKYYTKLKRMITSVGTWDHAFDPGRTAYKVSLPNFSTTSVQVKCYVDFARYATSKDWPVIRFNDSRPPYGANRPAVHRYAISSAPYVSDLFLDITVRKPGTGTQPFSEYHLQISRPPDFQNLLAVRQLRITDIRGRTIATQPPFVPGFSSALKYLAYVPANTRRTNVSVRCDPPAVAGIDQTTVFPNVPLTVPMNGRSTKTVVSVSCSFAGRSNAFSVEFRQHVNLATVALSLRIVGDSAVGTVTKPSSSTFLVTANMSAVVVVPLYNDTRVGLDLLKKNGQRLTLGNGFPTPRLKVPINGTNAMDLILHCDGQKRHFNLLLRHAVPAAAFTTTTVIPSPRKLNSAATGCGYFMTVAVAISILTVGFVRGVCEALNLGTPRFASPALRSLALLLQFLAMNSAILEPCSSADLARPLRWLAVSPPQDRLWQYMVGHTVGLGQRSRGKDDVKVVINDAAISLTSSGVIIAFVFVCHCFVLVRLLLGGCFSRRYTLPHRLRLGSWEARSLLIFAYPVSCAALLLLIRLNQDPPSFGGKVIWYVSAVFSLTVLCVLALAAECRVRHALRSRLVTWVFEGGLSTKPADNVDYDEYGYFCDATCDQLGTFPAERSCCASFISHRWGTTVADIQSIEVEQTLTERLATTRLLAARDELEDVAAEADGTAEVHVIATLRAGALCQPFYSKVGHFSNVAWLRGQLNATALIQLHQDVESHHHDFATPLRVNVSQLQGPVTCGWLSFCFDGLHWPHLPPLEIMIRVFLGGLTATALAIPSLRVAALFCSSILAGAFFMFLFFHTPCTRVIENVMLLIAYLGITLIGFEFAVHSIGAFSIEVCSWSIIVTLGVVVTPLMSYTVLTALSLFCAATCPIVSDAELESDRTNNVDLALRAPHDSWLLLIPAICSVPVIDAFVHTHERRDGSVHVLVTENVAKPEGPRPRLEFPVLDYLASTDKLEIPRVLLLGPSESEHAFNGYRSETIYSDEDPKSVLADFLRKSSLPYHHDAALTREVLALLSRRARPGHILVVHLLEPPRTRLRSEYGDDEGSSNSEDERGTLMGTSRNNATRMKDLQRPAYEDDWGME